MRLGHIGSLVCLCTVSVCNAQTAYASIQKDLNIPAEGLSPALQTVATTYDFQVLYRTEVVKDLKTHGAIGSLTSDEALTRVLSGTGLTYKYLDAQTVTLIPVAVTAGAAATDQTQTHPQGSSQGGGKSTSHDFLVAQVDQANAGPQVGSSGQSSEKKSAPLEEVVVTGTHIRGVTETASPTVVYTRDDIDKMGIGTIPDFLARIPQNFGGGAAENTVGAIIGGGNSVDSVGATSANLRGLGSDATLILIDGHRVAPTGDNGNIVDVSMIPVSAIERVEVVTDGASAIYGSDAVAGVVNFVLKKDFNGAETRARYGVTADGGGSKLQVGQTLGTQWTGGSVLVNYDYLDQTPLLASDRSFTRTAAEPFDLVPPQVRQALFASAHQYISSDINVYAEGGYSRRTTSEAVAFNDPSGIPFSGSDSPASVEAISTTIGTSFALTHDSVFDLSASYDRTATEEASFFQIFNVLPLFEAQQWDVNTKLWSVDPKLDGTLVSTPAGPIRYAVGGQYRRESLDISYSIGGPGFDSPGRSVSAGYLELVAPLLPAGASRTGDNLLQMDVAARYEHYSDFGSTFNPKVGLIWKPIAALKIRGTYGTSFKAPDLYALNPTITGVDAYAFTNPAGGAPVIGLVEAGGNANLTAQKAKTWQLGIDWEPPMLHGLRSSLTYYHVDFTNRIGNVYSTISDITNALAYESVLGPGIVHSNPSAAFVSQLVANPGFLSTVPGFDPSQVGVVIDGRNLNIGAVTTSGMDLMISDSTQTSFGRIDSGIDGTYILQYLYRFVADAPAVEFRNTPYNPVDFRLQAHASFTRGPLTTAIYGNYTAPYGSPNGTTTLPIASWTTLDGVISFAVGDNMPLISKSSVILSVLNIGNRAPPFVANSNSTIGLNYDGANANALGRFYSLQLSKRW